MMNDIYIIRKIRIDIPLKDAYLYFFIDPFRENPSPWWTAFIDYLQKLPPRPLPWRTHSTGIGMVAWLELSEEKKLQLVDFIKTAPLSDVEDHMTLKKAVKMTNEQAKKLRIVYFTDDTPDTTIPSGG
jgi:hypothetical protein